jgi:beta-galactosidase
MKDIDNALQIARQPGPLVDLLGGRVEQFYALDQPVTISGAPGTGKATIWAETLSTQAPDTTVLLRYGKSNGWLDDQVAAIAHPAGPGRIVYLGAWLDEPLTNNLFKDLANQAGITAPPIAVPEGVEITERTGQDGTYLFLLNHTDLQQQLTPPQSMLDLLSGQEAQTITLPPHGVSLLKETPGK